MKIFKLSSTIAVLMLFVVCAVIFRFQSQNMPLREDNNEVRTYDHQTKNFTESEESSIEMRKEYMQSFYYPKTMEEVERERSEYLQKHGTFKNLSPDYQNDNPVPWSCVGPFGIITGIQPPSFHSGRIISFAMYGDNTNNLFVGGASGGLWKSTNGGISWYNLLDTLSCPSVSSIATSFQLSDNTVWFSTGSGFNGAEPQIGRVYKSTNGGATWQPIPGIPFGTNWVSKIEINAFNKNIVYIATNFNLYKTTNGGSSFSPRLIGAVCDVVTYTNLLAADTSNIVAAVIGGSSPGIKRSTNGGSSFYPVTLPGANPSVINRISLSRDPGTSKTYALVGRNNGKFMGIWYSTDKGATWTQKTFPTPDSGGQSNYNQGIAVSSNGRVYVGYNNRNIYYSSDNGSTWQSGSSIHEDVHKIYVHNNSLVFHVSDGGIFKSSDQGLSWMDGGNNWLPLSQSYHLTADLSNPDLIWSGLQDNGLVTGFDGFFRWTNLACCDAGDYLRIGSYQYMNLVGIGGGSNKYQRKLVSAPPSDPWDDFTSGLPPGEPSSNVGLNDIKYDNGSIYTSMNIYVYKTSGTSLPWNQVGSRPHPTSNVTVGRILPISFYVLAGFDMPTNPVLRRYNNSTGNWETPNLTGIPINTRVTDFNEGNLSGRVFMTISGTAAPRVFKSTNSGSSWIDITGDLPNIVNARCLLVDHHSNDNIIYIGSDLGVYVTSNGGTNWLNYSMGLPSVCYVNDMEFAAGNNFVYAATYGRGVWKSPVLIGIQNISEIASEFSLSQNYPNPFNPVTNIEFSIPKSTFVKLVIYDIQGRETATIVNEQLKGGKYMADWNASNFSSGVYFYKLITDDFTDTKKMILVK